MNLCGCDSEERGVGAGVNVTVLLGTLQIVYYESIKRELKIKPI
jgi:hypothetical protein